MKKNLITCLALVSCAISTTAKNVPSRDVRSYALLENNGQIHDQNGKSRNDIQFVLPAGNVNVFIGDGALHYMFTKTEVLSGPVSELLKRSRNPENIEMPKANIHTYRLDVELVGADMSAKAIAGKQLSYYENYYTEGCPEQGIRAHTYDRVTYKNVYPDIDWVIYVNGNKLEHEFVVGKNGNASDIKLRYKGHTNLKLNEDGSITATTPMGTVTEKAPVCFSADGTKQPSSFHLNGNVLSYDLKGYKDAILIDPELIWGTYYGPDTSTTILYDLDVHDSAALYACGLTWCGTTGAIATSGGFQNTFGGYTDAFLVKFDTGGIRQWGTYYGTADADYATGVGSDIDGKAYLVGVTTSTTGIATPGSQQPAYGGGMTDGFLVKFDNDGTRLWGTYIGGAGFNNPWSVLCIGTNVFVSGETTEGTGISTTTGYQPIKSGGSDSYLIKYDGTGTRQWGTYFGGPGSETSGVLATDGYALYMCGNTASTSGIINFPYAHQTTHGGGSLDAYILKLFENGSYSWSTYYGGNQDDAVGGIACDPFGNIYLLGHTNSDNNISTATGFQPTRSGWNDAFVAKFHPEIGYRMWATYLGGPQDENVEFSRITTDDSSNVYAIGYTTSTSGLASDTAWQTVYGGGSADGFMAKFNLIGEQKWCSYLGGDGYDEPFSIDYFGKAVYVCGRTRSTDSIATPGALNPTGGCSLSFMHGFIQKIGDPDTSSIPEDTTTVPTLITTESYTPAAHLSLYPNPVTGTFMLHGTLGKHSGIAWYTITDAGGRIVERAKMPVHSGTISERISVASLPQGVYWIKVTSPEGAIQTVTFRKD